MVNTRNLYDTIGGKAYKLKIPFPETPPYINENLKFPFFDWQKEAFENFLTFQAIQQRETTKEPTHLMFNMATGTGKTLLMASLILYYYKQGYRHFIFFVNQNNIIDKTENNFIDNTHTKYLFTEKIVIDETIIPVRKVEVFSDAPQGIEIKFTTIQKLYNDIHVERENQTTLDDLHSKDIVMLADEAHHLNANTKRKKGEQDSVLLHTEMTGKTKADDIEKRGWEHTVIELILKKNNKHPNNKNTLLEFTATIPDNEQVADKYSDKTIYKFGLKEFLSAGYTKEINLISSNLEKKERVIQALLFHWYRHKIALKHRVPNFKPVMLFRSKTIAESKVDHEEFLEWTRNLTSKDFTFLDTISQSIKESQDIYEQGKSRTEQVLQFIVNEGISYTEIANFIKTNFSEKNVIITNSQKNTKKTEETTEDQEKLLNSLEDKNNHIRAIFTVDRLTEGWDVLNLFDIVRLYQGQNAGGSDKKTPEATTKEKQLIGRGVRYYPFTYKDNIPNKRKFDDNLTHELRVLEELYYYTYDEDSRYISHLKTELRKDGYIRDGKIVKTFKLKQEFTDTNFYKQTKIWYNEQIENPQRRKKTLQDLEVNFSTPYRLTGLELSEQGSIFDNSRGDEKLTIKENTSRTIEKKFKEIERHIFHKAINTKAKSNNLFQFKELQKELDIESIEDLQLDAFLGNFNIKIIMSSTNTYDDISAKDKLNITIKFLDDVFTSLKDTIAPKIGGEFKAGDFNTFFAEPKMKAIQEDPDSDRISQDLEDENWYVLDSFYGTSEEKGLIELIKDTMDNLEQKHSEIYLLRNEEVYKIFDYEKGRGFQPDFILFLKTKGKAKLCYQIFIEPKGNAFKDNDGSFKSGKEGWKETFLEQISEKHGFDSIIKAENRDYKLIGLPFFNQDSNSAFEEDYRKLYE